MAMMVAMISMMMMIRTSGGWTSTTDIADFAPTDDGDVNRVTLHAQSRRLLLSAEALLDGLLLLLLLCLSIIGLLELLILLLGVGRFSGGGREIVLSALEGGGECVHMLGAHE